MRLPLRDAVEKRPPPDEAIEADDLAGLNYQFANTFDYKTHHNRPSYQFPNNPVNGLYYLPQRQQSVYTPLQYFQTLVQDYKQANPYRIDNSLQQLLVTPFGRLGRTLQDGKNDNIKSKIWLITFLKDFFQLPFIAQSS